MATVAEIFDVGLVFGKFYPLTKGHQHLIDYALARSRRLYIAISGRPQETSPIDSRAMDPRAVSFGHHRRNAAGA